MTKYRVNAENSADTSAAYTSKCISYAVQSFHERRAFILKNQKLTKCVLQSVSEQIFNTISWHCIHHYVILLLIAYDSLVHEIRKQVMGSQGIALTKTTSRSLKRLCATADKATDWAFNCWRWDLYRQLSLLTGK